MAYKNPADQHAYYEANREKILARERARHEAKREEINARKRADYYADPEKYAARMRVYREQNPEAEYRRHHAYNEANRQRRADQRRAWSARLSGDRKGRWTPQEVKILVERDDLTIIQRATILDRSYSSCSNKLDKLRQAGYDV